MRTTVDLPDSLYRDAKATAAARGMKLKELVTASLRNTLYGSGTGSTTEDADHRGRMREFFETMAQDRVQTAPVGRLKRDELHDRHA